MADNMTGRAERPDLDDNDPFAELTRIMGHDPRQDVAQDEEADLAFDLENELLGTLDLSSDEDPEANAELTAADEPAWIGELSELDDAPAYREVAHEPVETASSDLDFSDFDAELNAAFDSSLDDHPALAEEMPVAAVDPADELSSADQLFEANYRATDDLPATDYRPAETGSVDDWQGRDSQPAPDRTSPRRLSISGKILTKRRSSRFLPPQRTTGPRRSIGSQSRSRRSWPTNRPRTLSSSTMSSWRPCRRSRKAVIHPRLRKKSTLMDL